MFTCCLRRFVLAFALAFVAVPAGASSFFAEGKCALVIASRPSVADARSYILENGWSRQATVYLSDNGWYAIAIDLVDVDDAAAILGRRKSTGSYPADAYCSTGRKYLRQVAWRATSDTEEPSIGLWAEFDARPLSLGDKRFLQAALAMNGHYNGLLDGAWGSGSQGALERYAIDEYETSKPAIAHAAWLAATTMQRMMDEGWEVKHVRPLGISMFLPVEHLFLEEESGNRVVWRHDEKELQVVFDDVNGSRLAEMHMAAAGAPDRISAPYTVRRERIWVTSIVTRNTTAYLRSDLIQGSWSTVGIFTASDLKSDLALMSSSIRPGPPLAMVPAENGVLMKYIQELLAFLQAEGEAEPPSRPDVSPDEGVASAAPPTRERDTGKSETSTGTAFFVNDEGVAITNAHVVDGCTSLTLDGKPAEIVSVSTAFDLAAIKLTAPGKTTSLPFAKDGAALNSDITIAGYPLHGLLGGLNVSRGSVSSMKGLAGDETSLQISAPVQPGNSGGPAINRSGGVVGVVVAKLDTLALADAIGDIAQNVNFAIRGSLAKVFLSSNGIAYDEIESAETIPPEKAAELLQSTTFLVTCD